MKVEFIKGNNIYKQNFSGNFKSPLDIKNTYSLLRHDLWYKGKFR